MNKNPIKYGIIIAIIILVFVGAYFIISKLTEDNSLGYEEFLKNYEVNEYIASYVSDEDMAKIYLNDYIHNMFYDVEKAYNLLDEEYKTKKFGSLDNFKSYVDGLEYSTYVLSRYYKKDTDGYIIFGVYDKNGNFFAFKTKGVLQYTVFLDDYTVEIWW